MEPSEATTLLFLALYLLANSSVGEFAQFMASTEAWWRHVLK